MKFRNHVVVLSSIALVSSVTLAGCGTSSPSSSSSVPSTSGKLSSQTITFWEPDVSTWQPLYKKLVAGFEKKYPMIHVNLVNIPESGFTQKLNTAIAGGQGPDVFAWYFSQDMYSKGFIQDLSSFMKQDHYNMNQFFSIAKQRCKGANGDYYALPRDVSFDTVFYNKALFNKYDVPYPKAGWTWADFEKISKELTHPKDGVYGEDLTDGDGWLESYPWFWDYGSDLVSKDGWNIKGYLDSSAGIKITQFAQQMSKDGSAAPASLMSTFGNGDYPDLLSGKIAMVQGTLWGVDTLMNQNKVQWGNVALPTPPGAKQNYSWQDSVMWYMNSKSQHKEAAWDFMKYMSSTAAGNIVAKSMTWAPANKQSWIDSGLSKNPLFTPMWDQRNEPTEVGDYVRNSNWFTVVEPALSTAYQQIVEPLQGKPYAPVAPTLTAAANKIQAALNRDKLQQGG